jgi:HD-like signal output (HDOD) protein
MQDDREQESSVPSIDDLVTRTTDLLPLPSVYFEVKRIIEDPDSSIIDLARAIALDPALTTRLLRMVNSAFYAQARPVETVSRAVSTMGTQRIHDLVLVTSLCKAFTDVRLDSHELYSFWYDSVHRAVLARDLSGQHGLGDPERFFVLGLLSHIGLPVLWLNQRALFDRASELARKCGVPLHQAESELLGFDHTQLGGALLASWKLPASIHQPIAAQLDLQPEQPFAMETAWLHVIGLVVEATGRGLDPMIWLNDAVWPLTGGGTPAVTLESLARAGDEVAHIHATLFPGQASR